MVAIFVYSDPDSYYVGKIVKLTLNEVVLNLINTEAEWLGEKRLALKKICYIGFGTEYEKPLLEKAMI